MLTQLNFTSRENVSNNSLTEQLTVYVFIQEGRKLQSNNNETSGSSDKHLYCHKAGPDGGPSLPTMQQETFNSKLHLTIPPLFQMSLSQFPTCCKSRKRWLLRDWNYTFNSQYSNNEKITAIIIIQVSLQLYEHENRTEISPNGFYQRQVGGGWDTDDCSDWFLRGSRQ